MHPRATPRMSIMSVQENRLGQVRSIHSPMAVKMSVGMATDQPTTPNIPRPNQMVSSFRVLPLIRRSSFEATFFVKASASLERASRWESVDRHSCSLISMNRRRRSTSSFAAADRAFFSRSFSLLELPHHDVPELAQFIALCGVADRYEDIGALLDEGAHIDGEIMLPFARLVRKDTRHERRREIDVMGQQAEDTRSRPRRPPSRRPRRETLRPAAGF